MKESEARNIDIASLPWLYSDEQDSNEEDIDSDPYLSYEDIIQRKYEGVEMPGEDMFNASKTVLT